VQRRLRRRRYRSAKCRGRPCYYIIYAEQQLYSYCCYSVRAPYRLLEIARRRRPFIYLYFNFFFSPLYIFRYKRQAHTGVMCVPTRNKLRSRDLKTSCVSMGVCEYLGTLIGIGWSAAEENASPPTIDATFAPCWWHSAYTYTIYLYVLCTGVDG